MLVVPRLESTNPGLITTGVMFDVDANPRQGVAVAWDGCREAAPSTQRSFDQLFVWTVVHEMGHAFNLLHTFSQRKITGPREASTSFMNYPSRYRGDQGSGVGAYWAAHQNLFDLEELAFMRHGRLEEVIMGGESLGSQGRASLPLRSSTPLLELTLRVRGPNSRPKRPDDPMEWEQLEFGSPVFIEAKLHNRSGIELEVEDALDPRYLTTFYFIEQPNGNVVQFMPGMTKCSQPNKQVLSPTLPSIYEIVQLGYGTKPFYFIEPGRYQIRAVYTGLDQFIVSEPLVLWISYPDSETEKQLVPTFRSEVSRFFQVCANPNIRRATNELDVLSNIPKRKNHPLVQEYERTKLYLGLDGYLKVSEKPTSGRNQKITVQDPQPEIKEICKALGLTQTYKLSKSGSDILSLANIHFGHLAGR